MTMIADNRRYAKHRRPFLGLAAEARCGAAMMPLR